jgi:DNA-binding NarL/FixJ family response regulator
MFLVLIVACEIADGNGSASPQPAERCPAVDRPELTSADLGLTARQLDVLALMSQGESNKAICRTLDLAKSTVKNHVTAILKAFNVTNRTQAVIAANRMAWHNSSELGAGSRPSRLTHLPAAS